MKYVFVILVFLSFACKQRHYSESLSSEKDNKSRDTRETDINKLLWAAVISDDVESVLRLLARGADFNHVDGNGNTMLMEAVKTGNLEIVEILLLKGAKVSIKNKQNLTVFDLTDDGDILLLLKGQKISQVNLDRRLFEAIKMGDLRKVRFFLRRGANVNAKNARKTTPLIQAVYEGKIDIVKALLENPSIRVNAKGPRGTTALYWARKKGFKQIEQLLIQSGAKNI